MVRLHGETSGYAILLVAMKVHTMDKHWYNVNLIVVFTSIFETSCCGDELLHGE